MKRYKLRYGGRPKAPFGTQEAAILAAAGINVAGSLTAAAIGADATKNAAQKQADATVNAAQKQAESLKLQNEHSKQLQEESQNFTREQNEANRDLQKQIQLNLQMLTGQQNANDRLNASRLQVKNGGSLRRKLKYRIDSTLLQGGYNGNMPFVVTDGGGVIPIGTTPEGFDLYEIEGDDHNHYHKTKNGKYKSGVGIKFANGGVVEGEGNQKTKQGEYLMVTPYDAMFISKHSINGFTPTKAINNGMHPLQAFAIQQNIKERKGIADDGKHKNYRGFAALGGDANFIANNTMLSSNNNLSNDIIAPTSIGVAYMTQQQIPTQPNINYEPKAKYGTVIRHKLKHGGRVKAANGWWDVAGAGITGLGNVGGALITTSANNRAMGYLADANTRAAGLLADAYSQMKGIDLSSINREDYSAPHAMAAVRAPIISTNPEITMVERALQRRLDSVRRNSLSAAAADSRTSKAEVDAYDQRSAIYSNANRLSEDIKQNNLNRITQVANENANRDVQANKEWANAYLNAMQYNNDIENQKIAGIAQSNANALTENAQIAASTSQANAQSWGSAIANTAQAFGNTMEGMAKEAAERRNVLIGADIEQQYRAAMTDGSRAEAQGLYDTLIKGTPDQQKMAANLDYKHKGRLSKRYNKYNV